MIEPGVYNHFKGNRYLVLGEGQHTETNEKVVVYSPLYATQDGPAFWVRPTKKFNDQVIVDGVKLARFQRNKLKRLPVFLTGNQHKADYLSRQLGIALPYQKVDLDEVQATDLHVIVEHKLRQAYEAVHAPVLVEDVSLSFNALGDLPGPYIKWFVDNAGDEACCRMLDGFKDRGAIIRCTFGYFDGETLTFFDSELAGKISDHPRGDNGFGFDKFFINEGYTITRAEMTQEENERTYAELMKPFAKVRDFLQKQNYYEQDTTS